MVSLVICAALILAFGIGVFWYKRHRRLRIREIQETPMPSRNRTPEVLNDSAVELNNPVDENSTRDKMPWWRLSGRWSKESKGTYEPARVEEAME
jgi:hypothetical protein